MKLPNQWFSMLLISLFCVVLCACIQTEQSYIGPSDWRMSGHDSKHTSCFPLTGPTTNKLKWSLKTENWFYNKVISDTSPAIGFNGSIYCSSSNGRLYAFEPFGRIIWTFTTNGSFFSSPAIGVDGTIYVGNTDKYLYAITSKGKLKWKFQTGGKILQVHLI